MISAGRARIADWPALRRIGLCSLASVLCLLAASGCSSVSRREPGRTVVEVKATTLPARVRRRVWRVLAQMAREGGDAERAQDCERAAAALE